MGERSGGGGLDNKLSATSILAESHRGIFSVVSNQLHNISFLFSDILRYSGFHILKQCQALVLGKETVEGARPPGHRAISSLVMLPPEQHPQEVAISQEMPITFSLQEGEISTPAPLQFTHCSPPIAIHPFQSIVPK